MNQLVLAGIAAAALTAGAFTAGWRVNDWRRDSQARRDELIEQRATDAATSAAVAAINDIEVKRVTIRQELEREIRYLPSDGRCDLSDGLFDTLNEAITGQPVDRTGLPATDAADGPAVRNPAP